MFNHTDGVMRTLAKKKTHWKEDLFFAVKLAWQKLSKCYAEVTPTTGMVPISALILDPFQNSRAFRKWDKGMDNNPEDETSCTTQSQEAFLKYVENKYCAKHWCVPVNKLKSFPSSNLVPSITTSRFSQSPFDLYDLSCNDEKNLLPDNMAETTPGWSNHTARWLIVLAMVPTR